MTDPPANWGKWGVEDERGAANYITPDVTARAARLVKSGRVYPLAIPLKASSPIWPGRHANWHVATGFNVAGPGAGFAEDILMIHTHGSTHIDALSHVVRDGKLYNGHDAASAIDSTGTRKNGIERIGALITRGVLIDVAGHHGLPHLREDHAILPDEIETIARAQGVEFQSGDAVLFRTGWLGVWKEDQARYNARQPGLAPEVGHWAGEREIAIMGADNSAVETYPRPEGLMLHAEFIRNRGGYLMELLDLNRLAADKVYEFMFVVAPLNITRGLGSPVTPVAVC